MVAKNKFRDPRKEPSISDVLQLPNGELWEIYNLTPTSFRNTQILVVRYTKEKEIGVGGIESYTTRGNGWTAQATQYNLKTWRKLVKGAIVKGQKDIPKKARNQAHKSLSLGGVFPYYTNNKYLD